jgi:hypothetical protein
MADPVFPLGDLLCETAAHYWFYLFSFSQTSSAKVLKRGRVANHRIRQAGVPIVSSSSLTVISGH